MQRYKKCVIRLNKEKVLREVRYKFGNVKNYCYYAHISTVRFYEIINTPHLTKEAPCLQKLTSLLQVSIDTILLWGEERDEIYRNYSKS